MKYECEYEYEYTIVLKHPEQKELTFIPIETYESSLEDICSIIEQQQKSGKIPYGYNLISISVKPL